MGMFILTALGILIFHNTEKLLAYNVALNGESNSTCVPYFSESPLTDGNKAEKVYFNNTCAVPFIQIMIKLERAHAIKYVILYGSDCSFCDGSILDYFYVLLLKEDFSTHACGQYAGKFSNNGMRVNCDVKHEFFFGVIIFSRPGTSDIFKAVAMTEIELHTIADENGLTYLGCFENFQAEMYSNDTTLKNCTVHKCQGYDYAALNSQNVCACGEEYPSSSLPLERCNNTCDGDIEFCGGPVEYSVYATTIYLPRFYACFRPNDPSILKSLGELSIMDCIIQCVRLGFHFALLQDKGCFCDPERYGRSLDGEGCNIPCKNVVDKNSICGGTMAYSAYRGCEKGHCEKLLHCKENNTDEFGVCVSGCEDGWTGEHCQFIGNGASRDFNWTNIMRGFLVLSIILVLVWDKVYLF